MKIQLQRWVKIESLGFGEQQDSDVQGCMAICGYLIKIDELIIRYLV